MSKFSVVQNFICDIPQRLEVIRNNTPIVASVWGDYEYFVNFNSSINLNEVHAIYKKSLPKLNFYNNLEKDWASITLALVNQVNTSYVIMLNEDMQFKMDKEHWDNIVHECFIDNDVSYMLLNKIGKYNQEPYVSGEFPDPNNQAAHATIRGWGQYPAPRYKQGKHVYFYDSKFARHKRVSMDAVYKTEWLKERLEEFILKGDACKHDIPHRHKHIPHFYEGYYDFNNGMYRFGDMKCAIPRNNIIDHYEEVKQNEFHHLYNKQSI